MSIFKTKTHPLKKEIMPNNKLGEVFKLPFGNNVVMNHYTSDMVYIEGVYGVGIEVFVTAYNALTEAIIYGAILPPTIRVVCVNKKEFYGSYIELGQIVKYIRCLTPPTNK